MLWIGPIVQLPPHIFASFAVFVNHKNFREQFAMILLDLSGMPFKQKGRSPKMKVDVRSSFMTSTEFLGSKFVNLRLFEDLVTV